MDLILLAAGFATRLEPLTLNQPKHLLPVKKGLFVDPLMRQLFETNKEFNRKVIITNDKYFAQFEKFAQKLNQGYEVYNDGVNSKDNRIGAIGDLLNVIQKAGLNDDLLVIAMDFIFEDFDFGSLIDFFKAKKSSVTVARKEENIEEIKAGSCILFDKKMKITRFEEKPKNPFSNLYGAPYYLIKKDDLKYVKNLPHDLWDNCGQIVKAILKESSIYAFQYDGKYLHMTTINDYNKIKEM
jgi:glucose-1-phosphate thymidylyltransferase